MHLNRSWIVGSAVAVIAVVGLVVAIAPSHSQGDPTSAATPVPHAVVSGAATSSLGALRLTNGYVPAPTSSMVAAYFNVINGSRQADTLLGGTSDVSRSVGLYDETETGSTEAMVKIASAPVPAGGLLALTPGHRHLMIINPSRTLKAGARVSVTLKFARAGNMTVSLPVVPLAETLLPDSNDMGGMNMSGMSGMGN